MKPTHFLPGCTVSAVRRGAGGEVLVHASASTAASCCPCCESSSSRVHSRYTRCPSDLPWMGQGVRLVLTVRRFYCVNAACARRVFSEQLPGLTEPRRRRTGRLCRAHQVAALALGGEPAARMLRQLGMPVSGDTLLRAIGECRLPQPPNARCIGVDDWAMRRGHVYGTIVVDLDRHRVIDLLPERGSTALAAWLRQHPTVRLIARDRSTEYLRAATTAAPHAVQVSDRWHLLHNAREFVWRWLLGVHPMLAKLPALADEARVDPSVRTRPFRRGAQDEAAQRAVHDRRQAVYTEVRRRAATGESTLRISREMGISQARARLLRHAEDFPGRGPPRPWPTTLQPYLPYLARRLAQGCESGLALWREVSRRGFTGTVNPVHRWLEQHRTRVAPSTPTRLRAQVARRLIEQRGESTTSAMPLPPARRLACMATSATSALSAREAGLLRRLRQHRPTAEVLDLIGELTRLVRRACVTGRRRHRPRIDLTKQLIGWFERARRSSVPAMVSFATALHHDGAAIGAALRSPYSNAQAEGQITKLKAIKRQMFGRAGFALLRRRVLLAA